MASKIQLRGDTAANWTLANPVLAAREVGIETDTNQIKVGNGVTTWSSLPYGGIAGPAQTNRLLDFGNGLDGSLNLSAGVLTLLEDTYYDNLTISGTGQLALNGFKLFCKTLDLSAAPVNAIVVNPSPNGVATNTQTGGAGGLVVAAGTLAGATAGGAGATGVVGVGAVAAIVGSVTPANGGNSGAGGAGGLGGSGAGGTSRAAATATVPFPLGRFITDLSRGAALVAGGAAGPGGSSGAGDGTNRGGGGGGGGAGGGVAAIFARTIIKSVSTPASCLRSIGGFGGGGATATVGNVGGGGGGAGGGGGWLYVVYETLVGPVVTNMSSASGGDGGLGGNGFGTGVGGAGGGGGQGGRITVYGTLTGTGFEVVGPNGSAGGAPSGTAGGAAGAGGVLFANL